MRTRRPFGVAALTILSAAASLFAVEFALRALDARRAVAPDYGDVFDGAVHPGGQLRPGLDLLVTDGYGGLVRFATNGDGFRSERAIDREKVPDALRILSLGDSFAAGYRVAQEDNYSRLLEQELGEAFAPRGVAVEVPIAVVADPATALAYLREYGLGFDPDVVLLSIALGNDVAQAYVARHPTSIGFANGLERLRLPPGAIDEARGLARVRLRLARFAQRTAIHRRLFDPPGIASWYGRFDQRMLFDPANGLGVYLRDPPVEIRDAYARLMDVLRGVADATRARGVDLALLVVPQRFQVQPEDWRAAVREYELRESAFDLTLPGRELSTFATREGLLLIDPTEAMRAARRRDGESLYQPRRDMHWNTRGQRAFFDAILPPLRALCAQRIARRGGSG